jgi:hypothetical protein
MQALLTIGFGLAFWALWRIGQRYREGEAPFDRLPAGVSRVPLGSRVETVADGTRYLVYFWPVDAAGRTFHVAEVKGQRAWISFWLEPSGKRTLYQSLAPTGGLDDLRKDWAV